MKIREYSAAAAAVVLLLCPLVTPKTPPKPCAESLAACDSKGCSKPGVLPPDPDLNIQKNRLEEPTNLKRYTFTKFSALNAKAVNKKPRGKWTPAEAKRIATVEDGAGAVLVGYLYDATLSDPETCNCYLPDEGDRDYHIWISKNANPEKGEFIVVEMTPRVRQQIQGWTLEKLRVLKKRRPKVRVTGLVTFDNEHYDFPKRGIRTTAWEIHPVTGFEVCPPKEKCSAAGNSGWVKLEDVKE